MNNPLVSIITVVFNGEKHLEQTIKSVLEQTYTNIEYIIIDGASTDGTLNIIKKYETQITTFISEKDTGIYNAMNKGLALATGEIIGILNADDYYYEKTIELVVQAFIKSKAEIIYGNLVKQRSFEGNNYFKEVAPNISLMEKTMPIFHPATFVKKEVYEKIGNFNEKYKLSADYDFIYRAYNAKAVFEYLPQPLTVFRIDGATSTNCKSYKEGYKILSSYSSPHDKQMRMLIYKCRVKNVVRFFVYFLLNLLGLKRWYERTLIEKWK
ncbi:MAG: glycosyltransferase [Bacteroidetes bacterium HGW-Bacteroidetes-12]|jgi:glycosyltransferase involved in cell wall biosynthesis|nr:MAG: glycosyltransferase [Bacteroidetes bacterium HGW-Bacteroidetes-12]